MSKPAVHPTLAEDSLLQALLSSEDAVFVYLLDREGFPRSLACFNDAACSLVGRSREELSSAMAAGFAGLKEEARAVQLLQDLQRRRHIRFQSEILSSQGSSISVEVTAMQTIYLGQTASVFICRNIESLRRKENLLRIVKRRYRAILHDQTEVVFRFLPSGRITFINQAGSQAFGLTAAAALKTNLFTLLPSDTAHMLREHLCLLTKDMSVKTIDCIICRPSGEYAAFEWTIRAIYARQSVIEYQVAGRDITIRKQLENELINHRNHLEELVLERTSELKAAHEQLQTLINTLPDIICFKDGRGRWLEANQFKLELLGLTDIDYKGKTDKDLAGLCPSCCCSFLEASWVSDQATWFAGIPQTYTEVITSLLGEPRSFETIKIPIFYPDGTKQGLVVVGRDITEKLQAIEAQKQLEAEQSRMDRLNLVGEMAVNIGHEIRNPMTTVRGYLQLMQSKLEFSKYQSRFELMISDLDKANTIITNFISLAKNKAIRLANHDLNKLIAGLLPDIQTRALQNRRSINASFGCIPLLKLDETEIAQLILNLIDNGLHVTPENQSLDIITYSSQGYTIVEISDKGPGIPDSIKEKLGMPFFSTKEGGTGLGLAVCYHIAQRHDAKIDIMTGPSGTTVSVTFKEPTG